uniref:F-box domain-containing protein n=1 Tax=Anisakis simplex TaxID=6269 RepID=A0A0M3K9V1_ANISI
LKSAISSTRLTTKIDSFEHVPDKCLLEVLSKLDADTICTLRLVNKRLNNLIQRHHDMLARKPVKGVHMRFETSDEVCRVRYSEHSTSDPHSKVSKKSTIKLCQLDSALRHLVITETVCIEGGLVGHLTRNTLQRSLKRHINSLDLINCTISLGCPLLTDRTLKEWADSLSWPQTILLRTLHSNITRQGVATMIESYIRWCKKQRAQPIPRLRSSQSLLWNFGTIDGDVKQLENAIGKLKKCMKITVIEASEEQFAAIIRFDRSSPVLHLRTSFTSRKRK